MRIIFAGTPDFSAYALDALIQEGQHEIVLVLTQPDRQAGRGLKLSQSAVKQLALRNQLPLYQPSSLKMAETHTPLLQAKADLMIVAAYGLILPQRVLDIPHYGCINIHASLLPRWRGAAPIQRAILAGDNTTGISIMQMDAGLDTGDVLTMRTIPIQTTDTTANLHDKLAICGAQTLLDTLNHFSHYQAQGQKQPDNGITYAEKIRKEEAQINWQQPAEQLIRHIHAFNPYPGAYSHYEGQTIKFWQADLSNEQGQPGQILNVDKSGVTIACQKDAITVTQLQKSGSKALNVADFIAGFTLTNGHFFS